MIKKYVIRPFLGTDNRVFLLKYDNNIFFKDVSPMEFTQLDILQIMQHLKGRNERIYDKFYRLVKECDKQLNEKTDFERKIPRRRFNGKFH
jgi:hypothetical protein